MKKKWDEFLSSDQNDFNYYWETMQSVIGVVLFIITVIMNMCMRRNLRRNDEFLQLPFYSSNVNQPNSSGQQNQPDPPK